MSGTRPSPFVQFIHDRGVRLAAGLAVVVAIPMAVLFYFQFKSLNDIETTSAVVLRQLSSETADSLTRAIEDYMKRPHISVLLRIPQARPSRSICRSSSRSSTTRWPKARSSNRSSSGRRSDRRRTSGWCSIEASKALPSGTTSGSAKTRWSATSCCARLRELVETQARDRRVHRDDQRPAALRAGAAALGRPGARAHDERGRVRGRRGAAARRVHPGGAARLAGERPAAVRLPAPRDRGARRERRAHLRLASRAQRPRRRRSTNAASRSSSSTRSCSNSRRRTSSTARSGGCGPVTARSRFRKSSAPARGRSSR